MSLTRFSSSLQQKREVSQDASDLSRPLERKSLEFDQSLILIIIALLLDMKAAKQASAITVTPDQPPLSLLPTFDLVFKEMSSDKQKAYCSRRQCLLRRPCCTKAAAHGRRILSRIKKTCAGSSSSQRNIWRQLLYPQSRRRIKSDVEKVVRSSLSTYQFRCLLYLVLSKIIG